MTKIPDEKLMMATKLHKEFGHPEDSNKLKSLLRNDIHDNDLFCQTDVVTDTCDTCSRYSKALSVVLLPIFSNFNECLAVDLKVFAVKDHKHIILWMSDVLPGFAVTLIPSKHKEAIVDSILKYWFATFGNPSMILSKNVGEFKNELSYWDMF